MAPFTGLSKKVVKTNPNFPQDLTLFKLVKKNKLSEYFCAPFWDSHFWLKREVFNELALKTSKQQQSIVWRCVAHLRGKKVSVYICPVLLLKPKSVVYNKSKFFSGCAPFQTCWEKQTFYVFLSFSLNSHFLTKNWIFLSISTKMPKNHRNA